MKVPVIILILTCICVNADDKTLFSVDGIFLKQQMTLVKTTDVFVKTRSAIDEAKEVLSKNTDDIFIKYAKAQVNMKDKRLF